MLQRFELFLTLDVKMTLTPHDGALEARGFEDKVTVCSANDTQL